MIPSLPPELVNLIMGLSLPPLKLTTYSERYSTLRNFSLVSKLWTGFAQEELIQHVTLNTGSSLGLFLNSSFKRDYDRIASIRVEAATNELKVTKRSFRDLYKLFVRCSNLNELWLVGLHFDSREKRNLFEDDMINLTSLHLIRCGLPPIQEPSPFPHVNHLTLFDIKFTPFSSLNVLNSLVMPALKSLVFVDSGKLGYRTTTLEISQPLASQVDHLLFFEASGNLRDTDVATWLSRFSNLRSLVLRDVIVLGLGFGIPSTLSSLSILVPHETLNEYNLIKDWISSSTSVINIKSIRLPQREDAEKLNLFSSPSDLHKSTGNKMTWSYMSETSKAIEDMESVQRWPELFHFLDETSKGISQ